MPLGGLSDRRSIKEVSHQRWGGVASGYDGVWGMEVLTQTRANRFGSIL